MLLRRSTAACIVTVLAVAGCGTDDPPSEDGGTAAGSGSASGTPSAGGTPAASDSPTAATGVVPVRLPAEGGLDWRIAVAPDGETALIARSEGFFPQTRQSTIYEVTRQADGSWGDQVEVPFVGEQTSDIDPFFSADGSRVWFSSIRAVDGVDRADVEVWSVDRDPDGAWAEPVHVPALGSPGDDLYPSIGPDGAMYVGSDRGGAGFDIWRTPAAADGTWGAAAALPAPVTSRSWEFNPVFSPDGHHLVFTAQGRDGGEGAGDLFASRLDGDTWSEPVALATVNSASDEYHPAFSPDGETLYLVRQGSLYEIPVAATELAG